MQHAMTKVDQGSVRRATIIAQAKIKHTLQAANLLKTDAERARRLVEQLCTSCYYLSKGGIAGQAITRRPCGLCEVDQIYSSTATHALCMTCANTNALCKRCGADMELRPARVLGSSSQVRGDRNG